MRNQVEAARKQLQRVDISDSAYEMAVNLALELKVQGHRADMALLKSARALAALLGKEEAGSAEVSEAAWFVLPHRLPGGAIPGAADLVRILGPFLGSDGEWSAGKSEVDGDADFDDPLDGSEFPGSAAAGSMLFETFKKKLRSG